MKMNFTIYHLTPAVDQFIKHKRSTNAFFKALSAAFGVSVEGLEALREAREQNPPKVVDKSHSWSIELTKDVIGNLVNMPLHVKMDFIGSLPIEFLDTLAPNFDYMGDFKDRVLKCAVDNELQGISFPIIQNALTIAMKDKYKEEIPCLTVIFNKGTDDQVRELFKNGILSTKIEQSYLDSEGSYPELFEAFEKRRNLFEECLPNVKAQLFLGKDCLFEKKENMLIFSTRKINCLGLVRDKKEFFKDFDFISYVSDVDSHKKISTISIKLKREMNEKEELFFCDFLKDLVLNWDISSEELVQSVKSAALNLKITQSMSNPKAKDVSNDDFKL